MKIIIKYNHVDFEAPIQMKKEEIKRKIDGLKERMHRLRES
jgi:hypothetical protein